MARGRRNRAEMALQGSFSNLTARIPTNLWEMLNDYARRHTANNRSLALERILREWQAWDNDVKEDIKDARAAALERVLPSSPEPVPLTPLELAKELGIE